MDHLEEEIILYYYKDKDDYVTYEKEVDCKGVWQSSKESRSVEVLEPQ